MEFVDLKELALKKVKITGNVIGKFGTFEIEQNYKNNTRDILEVGYTFPIVETATVVGFEINVGDKVLKGKCEEKSKAKEEYQKSIVKGNSAYMMEQETDNVFKISIGKIDSGEEVKIKIQYIDKFDIVDNVIQILIPTLVTPKYKSNITDKLEYEKVNYSIDFNININKMPNIKNISCPSHKIRVVDNEKTKRVEVLNYSLSKDFKLNIELKNELSSNAIISKTKDGKDILYLSFMPEILDSYEDSEKEYLFLIDISGSMMGKKLDETKKAVIECLKYLDVGDKFNIISFESRFEAMNIKSIEYNEENVKKAEKYINNLQPVGGTEILAPIKFALYERNAEKIIMLFTDGQVGNEKEIIKFVERNISRSRIFPFGIDKNVNSSFIRKLAKVGNGKAELIQPKEKIDGKIIRTFARIQTPLLEEVEIDYGNNTVVDEIKEENCLFNYEFFNVFAKLEKLEDDVKLKGKILNQNYIWKINKNDIYDANINLEILFAKQEIERLEEYIRNTYENEKIEIYKKMIVELSEKYNINSKYVSFITVYERKNKLLAVPNYQETKLSNDLDIPCFLRKVSNSDNHYKVKEKNKKILEKKVDEYYKVFMAQKEKSMLTFLLYALYYLKKKNYDFNYNDLLRFLRERKNELLENEMNLKLLCLCYKQLDINRFLDKKETLELMDDDFRKIAETNMKFNVDINMINDEEIKNIITNNKIEYNINEVIWYCYKEEK